MYVDEIRVQPAENRPQKQVQERLREYIFYTSPRHTIKNQPAIAAVPMIVPNLLQKYDLHSSWNPANPYQSPQNAITMPVNPTAPIQVFAIPFIKKETSSTPASISTDRRLKIADAMLFAEYFFSSKE